MTFSMYVLLAILFILAMVISHFLGFTAGRKIAVKSFMEVAAEMLGTSPAELAVRLKAFTDKRIQELAALEKKRNA